MAPFGFAWKGRIGVTCYCFAFVVQAAMFKMILDNTNLSVFQLLLLRGTSQILVIFSFMKKDHFKYMNKHHMWTDLHVWVITHTVWVIALHVILGFGLIGSAMSLLASGQFGSIIFAGIFLKEELKCMHLPMFMMISIFGMTFILQPPFIFGGNPVFTSDEAMWMYGLVIASSIGFSWARKLEKIPLPLTCASEAIAIVASNLIISLTLGWNDLDIPTIFLGLAFGLYALLTNMLFYHATPLIPIAEISFIRSFDPVWGYLLDFLAMSESLRWNPIIGSGVILIAMLLLACSEIESKPKELDSSKEAVTKKIIYVRPGKETEPDPTLPLKSKPPSIPIYMGPEQSKE